MPPVFLWVFLAFVVYRYLQGGYRIPALGAIRFEALIGIFLLAGALLVHARASPMPRVRSGPAHPRVAGWVVALIGLMFLHTIASVDFGTSWPFFVDRVVKFALFGFFIFSFVTTPQALRLFFGAYLLAFGKMTQEGITGYLSGAMVWENQGVPRLHGSTPSYLHPNSLGGTQLSTLPFVVGLWTITSGRLRIVLAGLGVGAILVSIFSGSRTAYVAMCVWVSFLIYRSQARFRIFVVVAVAMGLGLATIPSDYFARFSTIFSGQEIEGGSMDARKQIYTDAWEIFLQHPLGLGVAAFPQVRMEYFGRSQDTHSLYLEVATNLGIFGLFIFLGLIISLFRLLLHVERQSVCRIKEIDACQNVKRSSDQRPDLVRVRSDLVLIKQAAGILIGFLIIRLALGLFGHDLYEIYWWFAVGLAGALSRISIVTEMRARELVHAS